MTSAQVEAACSNDRGHPLQEAILCLFILGNKWLQETK